MDGDNKAGLIVLGAMIFFVLILILFNWLAINEVAGFYCDYKSNTTNTCIIRILH